MENLTMYKILFSFFFVTLIFTGCTFTQTPESQVIKKVQKSNKKLFEKEDALIMFALRAEQIKDYFSASTLFNDLYKRSNRKEYLYRSLQNDLYLKENQKLIDRIDALDISIEENNILKRLKIVAYIQLQQLAKALTLSVSLVEKSGVMKDYLLVSDIYSAQNEYDLAVKYLESAYFKDYNEKILDRMSIILYVDLKRKKDAIAQLETHTRVHGCSALICKRLIAFYSNENNTDGLLSTYLRYYKIDTKDEVAKQIIQLYSYKKQYIKLMLFLQESGSDDEGLLQIYVSTKNYEKAFPLARVLYEETGESRYLAQSVIYEYESQKNKNSQDFLIDISKKFEELIEQDKSALYLNYYGYILIDHEVDIKKGMQYVQKALELEPESSYYLDSLAWGHYKLGKCEKSLSMMEKIIKLEGGDDPEVLNHYEIIKKCKGKK